MRKFFRGFGLAIILFIYVIALFFIAALLIHYTKIPTRWVGIFQDAFVLLGVWLFNRYIAHVPINWWQGRQMWLQLYQALPAIIVVGLLATANLAQIVHLPFSGLMVLYLGYIILVGLTEEYIFRGVLMPLFARSFPKRPLVAVALSSVLFGGLHIMNSTHLSLTYVLPQILFAMAIGTLFASLYARTKNLLLPVILHALTDLSVVVQLLQHPNSSANLNFSSEVSLYVSIFYGTLLIVAIAVASRQLRHVKIQTD